MTAKIIISNKIMKEFIITKHEENLRLDKYLKNLFPSIKHSQIEIYLRKKDILVNSTKASAATRLKFDDKIILNNFCLTNINKLESLETHPKKKKTVISQDILEKIKDSIIFQNENYIVLNKPHGLATQGGSKITHSLDNYLKFLFPNSTPKLVHRLDKDTSGAIIIALNLKTAQILAQDIQNHDFKKKYLAIVIGKVSKDEGEITLNLTSDYKVSANDHGNESITHYKVLAKSNLLSLLEITPVTGRKHQIRVSCLEMGHPILGDGKYGGSSAFIRGFANKLHLHSYMISTNNSINKESYYAEISDYMKETLSRIKFNDLVLEHTNKKI